MERRAPEFLSVFLIGGNSGAFCFLKIGHYEKIHCLLDGLNGQFPSGKGWIFMNTQLINENETGNRPITSQACLGVPFSDFKKSLGPTGIKYSDAEIEEMRVVCDRIADLVFDAWLKRRNTA